MSGVFTLEDFEALMASDVPANILREILVCIRPASNEMKYYIMEFDEAADSCNVKFGRIGNNPQYPKYTYSEGQKKLREKLRKGYKRMDAETYAREFAEYGKLQV